MSKKYLTIIVDLIRTTVYRISYDCGSYQLLKYMFSFYEITVRFETIILQFGFKSSLSGDIEKQ